jgi:hypothetical protein
MSLARYEFAEQLPGDQRRCSLDVARDPHRDFCGTVRAPKYPDEQGAINVVELLFAGGARVAFFRLPGLNQCEVRELPAPRGSP